jgi:hypothetical protein
MSNRHIRNEKANNAKKAQNSPTENLYHGFRDDKSVSGLGNLSPRNNRFHSLKFYASPAIKGIDVENKAFHLLPGTG